MKAHSLKFAAFALACSLLAGCITPKWVEPAEPSQDAGKPTSGVLDVLPDGSFVVSPHFIARYQGLIHAGWGAKCMPPVTEVRFTVRADGNCVISSDALRDFMFMNVLSLQRQP